MAEVIPITVAHRGAYLGTASLYRFPDGSIFVMITDMADHMIESRNTLPERFELFAEWMQDGIPSLYQQADEFRHD